MGDEVSQAEAFRKTVNGLHHIFERKAHELRGLRAQQAVLAVQIELVERVLRDVAAALAAIGGPVLKIPPADGQAAAGDEGRRGHRMPERRAEYAGMTLAEAARALLDEGQALHVDELVERVFAVDTPGQAKAAKSSLAAAMHAAATHGTLRKVGRNTFARGESANGA